MRPTTHLSGDAPHRGPDRFPAATDDDCSIGKVATFLPLAASCT
jgi:hypothetical protein